MQRFDRTDAGILGFALGLLTSAALFTLLLVL